LETGAYSNEEEFAYDMRLVFSNARIYNPPESDICKMANTLSNLFERKYNAMMQKIHQQQIQQQYISTPTSVAPPISMPPAPIVEAPPSPPPQPDPEGK
jgi:hypothetical protein